MEYLLNKNMEEELMTDGHELDSISSADTGDYYEEPYDINKL